MLPEKKEKEAFTELCRLGGLPPFNDWSNPCYGDSYFAASLREKYKMSVGEMRRECGFDEYRNKWETVVSEFVKEHYKGIPRRRHAR